MVNDREKLVQWILNEPNDEVIEELKNLRMQSLQKAGKLTEKQWRVERRRASFLAGKSQPSEWEDVKERLIRKHAL